MSSNVGIFIFDKNEFPLQGVEVNSLKETAKRFSKAAKYAWIAFYRLLDMVFRVITERQLSCIRFTNWIASRVYFTAADFLCSWSYCVSASSWHTER